MTSTFTHTSRRYFIERLAVASTVLVASPSILLANNSTKLLRFAILGDDFGITDVVKKSDKITIVDDPKFATVIYVSKSNQKSQNYIQGVSILGKHLIIEEHETTELLIENCKKSDNSFSTVERSEASSKLFEKVNYYESTATQDIDNQLVITLLEFLNQHTISLKFKIISEYKPAEIPIS